MENASTLKIYNIHSVYVNPHSNEVLLSDAITFKALEKAQEFLNEIVKRHTNEKIAKDVVSGLITKPMSASIYYGSGARMEIEINEDEIQI